MNIFVQETRKVYIGLHYIPILDGVILSCIENIAGVPAAGVVGGIQGIV